MTAMNWLATQLAWEQRLVELRTADRPSKLRVMKQTHEAKAARKAAEFTPAEARATRPS